VERIIVYFLKRTMTEFVNFPAVDVKANAYANATVQCCAVQRRTEQLIAYCIGSEGPGREIGAITPREIVTLGNLYVSDERAGARVAELQCSLPRFGSPVAPRRTFASTIIIPP